MSSASLFTGAAVAAMLPLELLGLPVPGQPSASSLQQPILMHYAQVLSLIPTGFLGATFAFSSLSRTARMGTARLLVLGALFAVSSHAMFMPVMNLLGVLGAVASLAALAIAITFAGSRWWYRTMD